MRHNVIIISCFVLAAIASAVGMSSCDNPGVLAEDFIASLPDSIVENTDSASLNTDSLGLNTDSTTLNADSLAQVPDSIPSGANDSVDSDTCDTLATTALTVSEALLLYNPNEARIITICGYIVGSINSTSISGATFTAPFKGTNLLLADNPATKDVSLCIPVELKASSLPREQFNLADNPQMLGKKVTLTGSLERYFRVAGLKNTKIPTDKTIKTSL